ncbi:tudor domain-containing protein 15-like [Oncorhynchus nerka]|uniref:tudor domain-containing protein 15-like n=1 Tax=Oncorhynchus nerka TaxID=8023 RepID=UPI0031B88370
MAFPCALSCLNGQDKAVKIQQLTCFKKGLLGGVLDVEINGFDKEQNLYSVTVLSAEDYAAVEAGPIQDVPGQRECDFVLESEPAFPLNGYLYYETAIIQAMDNSVIVEEMQEDSVFEGYVEHVLNPGAFWLRTQKRNKEFEEMMENMAKHFSQVQLDEEILENPEPGALCCAMYELDMHYYRAMVTDTLDNGAEVFFIDFGNTEKVPRMCIKQIPDKFAIEPAFALSCSLVNVIPFDDVWTISATDYFRRAVSSKTLLVHVVHIRKDLYVVDLYERENNSSQRASKSITELLTTTNHAEFWKYTPSAPVIPKSEMEKKMMKPKTDFWCQLESKIPNLEDMMEAIQRKTNPHKDSNCNPKREKLQLGQQSPEVLPFPSEHGSGILRFAAAVTTPSEFYIVLEDLLLIMNNVSTILEDLPKELLPFHEEHLIPGSCCLVRSDSKNKWCRAEIVHSDSTVVVINLVDYGHCVDMPYKDWSELRRLPDQLTRLPKVTYPCTLRGVKSVEGQWTDEAVVFFQECICKKNLQIYFRQYISEAHWEVDIVADGVHVAKDLVDAGHAEYIDIMLGLRFQEQRPIRAPEKKQGMSRADRTSKVEPEMTPPRTNKFLRRLNEELELDGHTSSEAPFHGQGFEKAREKTARATEYPDGQGAEMMTHCSTMTGTRHCALM